MASARAGKSVNGGKLKVVDINKKQSEIEVKELKSLSQAIEASRREVPWTCLKRVPVCNSAAPLETDFDIIARPWLAPTSTPRHHQ